jgi:hypothetical protein
LLFTFFAGIAGGTKRLLRLFVTQLFCAGLPVDGDQSAGAVR